MRQSIFSSRKLLRYALAIVALLLFNQSYGQTKKPLVSDREYRAFFKDIQHSFKTTRIDPQYLKMTEQVLGNPTWKTYFSKEDILFQRKQIVTLARRKMDNKLLGSMTIMEEWQLKPLKINPDIHLSDSTAYYTLSYPLFSVDRKTACIQIIYNCGKYCSEDKMIVYRKNSKGWFAYKTILHIAW